MDTVHWWMKSQNLTGKFLAQRDKRAAQKYVDTWSVVLDVCRPTWSFPRCSGGTVKAWYFYMPSLNAASPDDREVKVPFSAVVVVGTTPVVAWEFCHLCRNEPLWWMLPYTSSFHFPHQKRICSMTLIILAEEYLNIVKPVVAQIRPWVKPPLFIY